MQYLIDRFEAAGDAIAFIDDDREFSYRSILDYIGKYSELIRHHSIVRGQVLVVVADYSPEMFCFIVALMKNGNILAPITHESVVEKERILEISEGQWFVDFSVDFEKIKFTSIDRTPSNKILLGYIESENPGLLLFSSGSTGQPKAILHNFNLVLDKFKVRRSKVTAITFLMLDHFGGINTLFHVLSNLGTVVTVKNRTVQSICNAIQKHKVELLPATPSFLNMLVSTDINLHFDLSSLRIISYGTEVMPQTTLDRLKSIFPLVKLQQTYGLSEVGVLRSQSRPDGSLWVKIGGEGFKTKVIDDILWIKSDYSMVGYLNAPNPFDSEGWFNTQDRVEVDGDYFKILGRVTDLMNIGGQKVYPSEIEDLILTMDNIEDVAVFSEKNNLLGNMIVAEVVLKEPESLDLLKKRIRKDCAKKLAPFKIPSKVIIADRNLYSARHKKIRHY